MRKLLYSLVVIVLSATAVFVWSRTALVPLQASTASSISLNQALTASRDGSAPISPIEIMVNHKAGLPAQQWEPH